MQAWPGWRVPPTGSAAGGATLPPVTREWDADAYDRLPIPMTRWGEAVLGWLELAGDERVLDAGCGTGQVTEKLRARLPRGEVVALDGSASMIERARERLGEDRVRYVVGDLERPLAIDEPVDAVLSTATFHWVLDHGALFRNLAAIMRPGAQLAAVRRAGQHRVDRGGAARHGRGLRRTQALRRPRTDARASSGAGFIDVEAWLHAEPSPIPPGDLELYLGTICLGDHVEGMGDDARASFVREVARRMPAPVIDYVRLNIRARRAG
jgi:trans-aconitate 2-methyltransferase